MLREWKQAALTGLSDLFERPDSVTELKTAHERELEQLYAEIGRLTTHVNFLKKSFHPNACRAHGVSRTWRRCAAAAHAG
jgi:hypothetical protein